MHYAKRYTLDRSSERSSFLLHRKTCAQPGYLCFFGGVFAGVLAVPGVFAACGFVSTPPSSSERPSSTSTVCVTASVPLSAGWAAAGAMVCVVGAVDVTADDFPHPQADRQNNAIRIGTDSVTGLFTNTSWMDTDAMQFP